MEARGDQIGAERVDETCIDPSDLYDAWREATAPVFQTHASGDTGRYRAEIEAYNLDGVLFTRVRFGASMFQRTEAMLKRDAGDCITVQHYVRGGQRGRVGEHELVMGPDRISIQDFAVPYQSRAEDSEVLGVTIARDRVTQASSMGARHPLTSLPRGSAQGALLASAMDTIWTQLVEGTVVSPAPVAAGFLGLFNGLFEGFPEETADERGVQAAMEAYLRDRLDDPSLGVVDLQREFSWSRSAIYRLFEPHGGVAAYIRTQRLLRCHAVLARPHRSPETIAQVASRFGFVDASQFTRAFRREFDIAPSQLVEEAARARARSSRVVHPVAAPSLTIRSWLEAV